MTSLKDLGTKPRKSQAWEPGCPEIVRFTTDEGASYGFLWHVLILGAYVPEHESLFLQYGTGTIIITGPKVRCVGPCRSVLGCFSRRHLGR